MSDYRQRWKSRQDNGGALKRAEEREHAKRFLDSFYGDTRAAYEAARKKADRAPEFSFNRTRYNAIADLIKGGSV